MPTKSGTAVAKWPRNGRAVASTDTESLNAALLASFIAHDVKTPARMTRELARMALDEHGDQLPDAVRKKLELIRSCTEQMTGVIDSFLMLAQIDESSLKRVPVEMSEVARDAVEQLRPEFGDRVDHIYIDTLPVCRGDAGLLRQVYFNLFGNALKFTRAREHPMIRAGATLRNGAGAYYVSDNGVGFARGDAGQVFAPYRRLSNATLVEGSGIGMAIVKRIIDVHGGALWVDSKVGRGATIFFTAEPVL